MRVLTWLCSACDAHSFVQGGQRQTDRQTDRQTHRHTETETETERQRQRDRQGQRQRGRERQRSRQRIEKYSLKDCAQEKTNHATIVWSSSG